MGDIKYPKVLIIEMYNKFNNYSHSEFGHLIIIVIYTYMIIHTYHSMGIGHVYEQSLFQLIVGI